MSDSDTTREVEYRAIPGFPVYRVGSDGTVWSRRFRGGGPTGWHVKENEWRIHCPGVERHGYLGIRLWRDGRYTHFRVSRLVLLAFVGPCPDGCVAAHNNGVNDDNRLENLRWATQADNVHDQIEHGTALHGERHYRAKLTALQVCDIRRRRANGEKIVDLAKEYGVVTGTIGFIIRRRNWKSIE